MNEILVPLPDERMAQLRRVAAQSGITVEALGRRVVEEWLDMIEEGPSGQWRRRLGDLLERRRGRTVVDPAEVDQDVIEAVREVRRRARGH